jgi:hypothetical protein
VPGDQDMPSTRHADVFIQVHDEHHHVLREDLPPHLGIVTSHVHVARVSVTPSRALIVLKWYWFSSLDVCSVNGSPIALLLSPRDDVDAVAFFLDIVAYPNGLHASFPFRKPIRAKSFSVTGFLIRLMSSLFFDRSKNWPLFRRSQLSEILTCFRRTFDCQHRNRLSCDHRYG